MKNRNIVIAIILSIVTFGIYGLIWFLSINKAANEVSPTVWRTGGVGVILLTLITCGIYAFYWNYKMGKAFAPIMDEDRSMLFLILSIFGLSIVNTVLIQLAINKKVA